MKVDLITTLLDVLAVLLVAAGVGLFVAQWIGFLGLAAAGVVILGASQAAAWSLGRKQ